MRRAQPGNQRPKRVRPPGAVVLQVDPQSAAERAGLKPGDLVTELDGRPVRDAVTSTPAPATSARAMARSTMRRRIASSRSWLEGWRWSALVAANRMRSARGRNSDV